MLVTYIQKITFIYNINKNEVNYKELKKKVIKHVFQKFGNFFEKSFFDP